MTPIPGNTPTVVKHLILWTCIISLVTVMINAPLYYFTSYELTTFLGLSRWGLSHYFLWQPITYFFTVATPAYGLTFSFLLGFAFQMYALWFMGSMIVDDVGKKSILWFYFLSGIFSGLLTLFIFSLFGKGVLLAGPTAPILAIFTAWIMLYPDLQILLFFLIPVQAKWVFATVVGAFLLINLTQLNVAALLQDLSAIGFAYIYSAGFWNLRSPWLKMRPLDIQLSHIGSRLTTLFSRFWECGFAIRNEDKFFDIRTGKPLSDDNAFVEAMLAKISREGEKSLSYRERSRLQKISERNSRFKK